MRSGSWRISSTSSQSTMLSTYWRSFERFCVTCGSFVRLVPNSCVYSRKTEREGVTYNRGDGRRVDMIDCPATYRRINEHGVQNVYAIVSLSTPIHRKLYIELTEWNPHHVMRIYAAFRTPSITNVHKTIPLFVQDPYAKGSSRLYRAVSCTLIGVISHDGAAGLQVGEVVERYSDVFPGASRLKKHLDHAVHFLLFDVNRLTKSCIWSFNKTQGKENLHRECCSNRRVSARCLRTLLQS